MRTCKLMILAFGLALAFGDSGHAGLDGISPIGGTCVPDSATIRAGHYETAGFGVRFGGNSIGKIRLLCPLAVALFDDSPFGGMWMSVIDADGMEAGGRIRAHLHRAVQGTNIWIEIGTCDSNTSNTTTPQKIFCPFDPFQPKSGEWYWWDVEIERTTPNVNVEFLGIEILYVPQRSSPRPAFVPPVSPRVDECGVERQCLPLRQQLLLRAFAPMLGSWNFGHGQGPLHA